MLRIIPLMAILVLAACSKEAAQASSEAQAGEAPAADAQAAAAKPVPAQLPDVVARVNGEDISRSDFERALQNMEARAGGPVPAAAA